jgi:hypothetical protein
MHNTTFVINNLIVKLKNKIKNETIIMNNLRNDKKALNF